MDDWLWNVYLPNKTDWVQVCYFWIGINYKLLVINYLYIKKKN